MAGSAGFVVVVVRVIAAGRSDRKSGVRGADLPAQLELSVDPLRRQIGRTLNRVDLDVLSEPDRLCSGARDRGLLYGAAVARGPRHHPRPRPSEVDRLGYPVRDGDFDQSADA